jgi:hypothetical protein
MVRSTSHPQITRQSTRIKDYWARALGGNAQLRSELGKGTTVVVSLHALAPSSA